MVRLDAVLLFVPQLQLSFNFFCVKRADGGGGGGGGSVILERCDPFGQEPNRPFASSESPALRNAPRPTLCLEAPLLFFSFLFFPPTAANKLTLESLEALPPARGVSQSG